MTTTKQAEFRAQILLALAKTPQRHSELNERLDKMPQVWRGQSIMRTLIQMMENGWVNYSGGEAEMKKRVKESRAWQKWFMGDRKKPAPPIGSPAKYQLTPLGREIVELIKS